MADLLPEIFRWPCSGRKFRNPAPNPTFSTKWADSGHSLRSQGCQSQTAKPDIHPTNAAINSETSCYAGDIRKRNAALRRTTTGKVKFGPSGCESHSRFQSRSDSVGVFKASRKSGDVAQKFRTLSGVLVDRFVMAEREKVLIPQAGHDFAKVAAVVSRRCIERLLPFPGYRDQCYARTHYFNPYLAPPPTSRNAE